MYYKPEFFTMDELVDKATYDKYGESALVLFNPLILISLDNIRKYFDTPVYVNNWDSGGDLQFRGFRPRWSEVGSVYSQHRLGQGIDCTVKNYTAEYVRNVIINDKDNELFKYITCLEDKVSWVHADCRNIPDYERIKLINP